MIHYTMGNSPKKNSMEPPQFFPMGNSLLFYPKNLMGNPHLFFYLPPYGKFPKKIWKKIFSSGYMDNCSPKNGGAPWGEGAWGDTYPPYGIYGGGDYLFGCLFGYYLFSALLILFILAVSDAMLSFISATFLLWRYLL